MPEGPEARYWREVLKKKIVGKEIKKITALSKTRPKLGSTTRVRDVGSRGKLIWIETTDDRYIHLHLMLTGWLYFQEPEYTKYIVHFTDFNLYFESKRKLSTLKVYKRKQHLKELDSLGVDIFSPDFTPDYFQEQIESTNKKITSFIMDQDRIAGCGNYMKSDSLYIAKISPLVKTSDLSEKQTRDLYKAIRYVAYSSLYDALKNMRTEDENGKKIRLKIPKDITNSKPNKISVPYNFKVYGQDQDPKGNPVKTKTIGGRTTYYVPSIQRK